MHPPIKLFLASFVFVAIFFQSCPVLAKVSPKPVLSAKAAVIIDPKTEKILYSKNAHLKLPPASTTKVMTAIVAMEKLPLQRWVMVSKNASNVSPSKAGLTRYAKYRVRDLVIACLVSSSNDAAVTLAEAVAGSEDRFAALMNAKAKKLGMKHTRFINATGLPGKEGKVKQYSTAYDLARLMRYASRDSRIDKIMGIMNTTIRGSDGKEIVLKSHNKMLWRMPKFVKGKTGWTIASRHTFVGTNYAPNKKIIFAFLSSKKPWLDIEKLASFGLTLKSRNRA